MLVVLCHNMVQEGRADTELGFRLWVPKRLLEVGILVLYKDAVLGLCLLSAPRIRGIRRCSKIVKGNLRGFRSVPSSIVSLVTWHGESSVDARKGLTTICATDATSLGRFCRFLAYSQKIIVWFPLAQIGSARGCVTIRLLLSE